MLEELVVQDIQGEIPVCCEVPQGIPSEEGHFHKPDRMVQQFVLARVVLHTHTQLELVYHIVAEGPWDNLLLEHHMAWVHQAGLPDIQQVQASNKCQTYCFHQTPLVETPQLPILWSFLPDAL